MANRVLYNATVHTLSPKKTHTTAIALRDDRVLAVGSDAAMRALLAPDGKATDLKRRCIIPGLIDSHLHFEAFSLGLQRIDAEAPTLESLLERVRAHAQHLMPGQWVLGWGWNHNAWDGQLPDREMLDRAAPDHPVFLHAKSGHAGWANSRALQLAGVDRDTPNPSDGEIIRSAGGDPSGIFLETAQDLVLRAVPAPSTDEVARAMLAGQQRALSLGLTGVHDLDGTRAFSAWQQLRAQNQMQLRVCKSLPVAKLDEALALGLRSGLGDEWLRFGGIKIFSDGALGPRTAWMLAPYENEPHNTGMPLMHGDELTDAINRASAAGLACFVHAIGDRANREVLDALQNAPGTGLRHRIEHAQLLHPDDLPRFAALGITACMQPIHATSDMELIEKHWGTRGNGAYAFKSLLATGATLAFGSDTPVETIDPLEGLQAAVTRRRTDGTPGEDGFYPQERLSVDEALRAYALGAAYAASEEHLKGSLTPGKLADLVVLERDILSVDPMQIRDTAVLGTMVGGIWQYVADGFDPGE